MTGLTIRSANNEVILNMTSNISQTAGSVVTNAANGSMLVPLPPDGKTAFFIVVPLVNLQREKGKKPGVSLVGQQLTWTYSFNPNGWGYFAANCRIYYGYY